MNKTMHLYIITRGIKHQVDKFITELQGKYLPTKWDNKDGWVQTAVRPIQLWEIVFPEKSKDLVLNTILQEGEGKTQHKRHNKFIFTLRKILGIGKIPKYDKKFKMPISLEHIEVVGVGVKEDYYVDTAGKKVFEAKPEEKRVFNEGL